MHTESASLFDINRCFFCADTHQKVDNIHQEVVLRVFAFLLLSFGQKFSFSLTFG